MLEIISWWWKGRIKMLEIVNWLASKGARDIEFDIDGGKFKFECDDDKLVDFIFYNLERNFTNFKIDDWIENDSNSSLGRIKLIEMSIGKR